MRRWRSFGCRCTGLMNSSNRPRNWVVASSPRSAQCAATTRLWRPGHSRQPMENYLTVARTDLHPVQRGTGLSNWSVSVFNASRSRTLTIEAVRMIVMRIRVRGTGAERPAY
jgi:hypothetical protein